MKLVALDLRRIRRSPPDREPLVTVPGEPERGGARPRLAVVQIPTGRRQPQLTVTLEQCGRAQVLVLDGEMDLCTAPLVRQALDSALRQSPRRLVVDLSLVRFLDSAGMEELRAAHHRAPRTDLRLVATSRATWRPLQITRLHEQLIIHSSRAEAIAAPAQAGDEGRSPPAEITSHESTSS